jgi:hypothetical protein
MSAQSVAINLLAQLIPGFLMANRPVPNMVSPDLSPLSPDDQAILNSSRLSIPPSAREILRDRSPIRVVAVHPGAQVGPLHEGATSMHVCRYVLATIPCVWYHLILTKRPGGVSPSRRHGRVVHRVVRRQGVVVQRRTGYLLTPTETVVDLPIHHDVLQLVDPMVSKQMELGCWPRPRR